MLIILLILLNYKQLSGRFCWDYSLQLLWITLQVTKYPCNSPFHYYSRFNITSIWVFGILRPWQHSPWMLLRRSDPRYDSMFSGNLLEANWSNREPEVGQGSSRRRRRQTTATSPWGRLWRKTILLMSILPWIQYPIWESSSIAMSSALWPSCRYQHLLMCSSAV